MKTSEILERARTIVDRGWIQGRAMDMDGNHCIVGALREVEDDLLRRRVLITGVLPVDPGVALETAVHDLGYPSIVKFNDDPATTKQDVLDLFDKVIASLEELGW